MKRMPLLPALLVTFAAAPVAIIAPATPATAYAAQAEKDVERAEMSRLADVRLPGGAYRSTSKRDLAKFADALQTIARTNHGRMTKTEVLIWRGGDADRAMKTLPEHLKKNGYNYAPAPAFDAEPGHVTPFGAVVKGKPDGLLGMWIETKDEGYALLAWGHYTPDNPDNPGHPVGTEPAPATTEEPAAPVAEPAPNEPEPAPTPEAPTEAPTAVAEPAQPSAAAATNALATARKATKADPPSAKKQRVAAGQLKSAKNTTTKSKAAPKSGDPLKKLNDYNYVKYFGPISGPMYRSSKW